MQGRSLALLQDLKSPHFDEVVAYNLIQWATFRPQKVKKQREDEKIRQRKAKMRKKTKH